MDEKLKALYDSLSGEYDLGSFQEFSAKMQIPEKRKLLYDAASKSYDLGDYKTFESKVVKKKVSTKDSAFNWETGEIDFDKLSYTQPVAPPAGKSSNPSITEGDGIQINWDTGEVKKSAPQYSWSDGKQEALAGAPYATSEISSEVQDSPQTRALKSIRERRGTDYSTSAADMAKGRIDIAAKRTATPLEMLHSAASQLSFGDWVDEPSTPKYNPDQRTAAEFNAFSKALSDENKEIGLAIKGLESKMKLEYGVDMEEYGGMVAEFNAIQANASKIAEAFNKLPDNKKTQEEADRVNAEIEKLIESSKSVMQRLEKIQATPEFEEMSNLYELSNINTKKYEDELKTGKYDHAKQFGDYLQYRQKLKDESYKKMSGFEKVVNSTGTVILHSLAKVPQSIASLTDVIEKSVGLEGEKVGVGDMLQDTFIGLGDDIQAAFPAPTKLQRGGFTDTAKWGDYQVDFASDGEIQSIRDKDGYIMDAMLSEQQEKEIKSLKKERQFNSQSFAYQTGSTIADVGIQILGTKGIGGIKALPGVVGTSWGLPRIGMKALGSEVGMIATTAGMMSNDLYNEGLENGLSEDDAARYALSTGTVIGLVGTLAGVGIEEQLLLKSKLPSIGLRDKMPGVVGRKVYDVIKGGAGEFTEEIILEKLGQAGVQYAMNEMAGGKFDIQPYKDAASIINEAVTAVVAGGLFSGLEKIGERPNAMQRSFLIDGSRNIPATMDAVRSLSAANGVSIDPEVEAALIGRLETTAIAVSRTPEEHHGDMEVIGLVSDQVELEEENRELQERIKGLAPAFTAKEQQKLEENKAKIEELSIEISARIQRKDLFSAGGSFSNILGGSGVDSVPSNQRIVNGIEFVEYTNPKSGVIDVVMSGTSGTDYVGFYRIYENGKPTNKWSSKFENQSRNKENFKTMISGVQEMLPAGHEYTEKTSISTDGLRVWNQQLSRGYELQYDENGKLVTDEVAINGDAIVNELGINVNKGNFENISVTTNEQFNKVKAALKPYLEKFGLNESNIRWENGTVMIDLPVLRSTNNTAKSTASSGPAAKEGEVLAAEPVLVPVTVGELEVGKTYYNEEFDRNYVFTGISDSGMYTFEKVQKKGEPPLMNTKHEAFKDSLFMKKLLASKPKDLVSTEGPGQKEGEVLGPPAVLEQPNVEEPIAQQMAQDAEADTSSPDLGRRLRGFYANSLPKMEGVTAGQALLADIGKNDPQFYDRVSQSGNMQLVADEIDGNGLEVVVQKAMVEDSKETGGVQSARRVVALIALGRAMSDANNKGDKAALDFMRNTAMELERLLGKKGTEFGQELAMYAIYSQTPEGQLAARLRAVEEKRERTRTKMTEGGRQVGDVVDSIVEDVAKELGITKSDAEKTLASVYGKKKAISAARETIVKGKKEVEEARAAIKNIMFGRANVGLPVSQYAKAGKQFIKLFSGYAKIYKGNLQKIKAFFRKDVNEAGLDGNAAYEWLKNNHPEITGPIEDFHEKMLNAIVGFYNGDIKGDLATALEKIGIDGQEALAVAEEFSQQWGEEIARKKASRLKQIVRTHVKSVKKAKIIENGLLEAITLGGLNDDAIRQKLEEKYGIKSFTNEQINELNQMVMDMKDMPSRDRKFKQMKEMMDYMHVHGGIDIPSFIASTWYARLLFSLKTIVGAVAIGNEINYWNTLFTHALATDGGMYALSESLKRLVSPTLPNETKQQRGLWFGLAEAGRMIKTGEGSREMKKITKSSDLEIVAKMSMEEPIEDAMRSFRNIPKAIAKEIAILHSRVFRYSLRAIAASDAIRYYSMIDFTLDRKAYNVAVAEGFTGEAARARAKEIVGDTFGSHKKLYDQAVDEFTQYAARRSKKLDEMFTKTDIAYRVRELAEEQLDAAWRSQLEKDAELQGWFPDAVQKVMDSNPGMTRARAEKVARNIRRRYYDNQLSSSEKAKFEAEKVALQNDPQGLFGIIAEKLGKDIPNFFDQKLQASEAPEPTGDQLYDEIMGAFHAMKVKSSVILKVYSSFVFPFMKTMANVMNMKFEHLPGIGIAMKGLDGAFGKPTIDWKSNEQVRVFAARQVQGLAIAMVIGAYMRATRDDEDEPVITFTGSKDQTLMSNEKDIKKWKQETIRIGDKRIYYGDSPYAAVLGLIGGVSDAAAYSKDSQEQESWTLGATIMAVLGQMFTNASYLRTFNDFNTAIKEGDETKLLSALANPVTGFASSGLQRDFDRWIDPELRDRRSIENRFVGDMISKTPFAANYLLDFRYNSLGETINPYENESILTQAVGLDKYITSTVQTNPVFIVLAEKQVRFKGIGKGIDILGTEATYQEKRDYTLFVGRYRRKVLNQNISLMRLMSPEQLELQLDKTDSEAKRAAELFVLLQRVDKKNPELGQTKDASIESIDDFINRYDPEMVKEDSDMYMEMLQTEKPDAQVDKSLFF